MSNLVYRTAAGLAASFVFALPCFAEVSVVGCIIDTGTPQITDDPTKCTADHALDVVSIKGAWTNSGLSSSAGGGGAGKVTLQPFVITKRLDRASTTLFADVVTGRQVRGVLIAVYESNNRGVLQRTFSFLLEDAIVSSLEFDAADSRSRGATPVDVAQFNYAKITIKDEASHVSSVFDAAGNRLE